MDKELKDKWVDALRSGTYTQGRNRLKQVNPDTGKDEYCCLGVLCNVVNPSWIKEENRLIFKERYLWITTNNKKNRAYDIPINLLSINHQIKLIKMNDTFKKNFAEIADYIEQNI